MTHKQKRKFETNKSTLQLQTISFLPSFLIASACSFSSEWAELPTRSFSEAAVSVQRFVARHYLAAWAEVEAARCLYDEASQKKEAEAAASISSQASQTKAEGAAACFAAIVWAAKTAIVYAEAELAKQKQRQRGGRRDLAF